MAKMTPTERVQAHHRRKQAAGYRRTELWVAPEHQAAVRALVRELANQHERTRGALAAAGRNGN